MKLYFQIIQRTVHFFVLFYDGCVVFSSPSFPSLRRDRCTLGVCVSLCYVCVCVYVCCHERKCLVLLLTQFFFLLNSNSDAFVFAKRFSVWCIRAHYMSIEWTIYIIAMQKSMLCSPSTRLFIVYW